MQITVCGGGTAAQNAMGLLAAQEAHQVKDLCSRIQNEIDQRLAQL